MGYLEIIQGKGTFVQSSLPPKTDTCSGVSDFTTNPNLFNLFEIREVLECHVVEKAARIANEEQLALLSKAVRKLSESIHESQNFLAEDLNFHMQLANAAELPEIAEIIKNIHTTINMKFPVLFTTTQKEKISLAIDTANRVYHYVLSGEVGPATRCMRNHLNIAKEAIRTKLMEEIDW